ncbi:DgyrCDS7081 [Dimorphilus gyrociliatus]|uniref:DgyrCDS7081 n=1 Tax=Dimorphilus gyrociliatus TaxID=2664684 RepID=A0A7I8VS78_9ANNE|nr:DgyrCDS7081 [Dimorphilus gyrociliatus]
MKYIYPLVLIGQLLTYFRDGVTLSDEKKLIKDLLKKYSEAGKVGRPVQNTSHTISVTYGLALIQLLDLDEKNQILTTNCWSRYTWYDIFLKWDPKEYNGVETVRIPSSDIWTPDIVLYNYADTRLREHRDAFVVVSSTGGILWIPPAIYKSSCVIDITYFPFDRQTCWMKFGSWTYDGWKLNISFYSDLDEIDLNDYIPSNEWDVLSHRAKRNVRYYPCCKEPYPDLTFIMELQRKVAFYNYILILPCVLLSTLTLVLFWLPPESPAKMVLGMNIFVAFFVLLLLLAESTPPAASSIPLIGAYYCLNMIMITLSTFLSVIVINLYFRGDKRNRVPQWLKRLMIDILARIMCMRGELVSEDAPKNQSKTPETVHTVKIDKKTKRKVKCPEMKYNKFQMYELKEGCPSGLLSNHNSTSAPSRGHYQEQDRSCFQGQSGVEADVKEIRKYLKQMLYRIQQKEEKGKIALEWRIVAMVLDRFFFFMYLIAIVISLVTIFPKTA